MSAPTYRWDELIPRWSNAELKHQFALAAVAVASGDLTPALIEHEMEFIALARAEIRRRNEKEARA